MYVDSIDFIMCDVFTQYILGNHYMACLYVKLFAIFIIFEAFNGISRILAWNCM